MWFGKGDNDAWERHDALKAYCNVQREKSEERIYQDMDKIKKQLDELESRVMMMQTSKADITPRMADVEVKMAKLWSMLTETTPRNKEKLSRFGKMFGGQNKDKLL